MNSYHSPSIFVSVEKPVVELGGEQTVSVFAPESSKVGIIVGDYTKEKSTIDSRASFSFKADMLGENEVIAYSSEGNTTVAKFFVAGTSEDYVQKIIKPDAVIAGRNFTIAVMLKNSSKRIKLSAIFENQTKTTYLELDKTNVASFRFIANNAGNKPIQFVVSDGDVSISSDTIKVLPAAIAKIGSLQFERINGSLITHINFITTPTVVNLSVGFVNKTNESNHGVTLAPGEHKLILKWNDILGNAYTKETTIKIPESPRPASWFGIEDLMLVLALSLIFICLVAIGTILHIRNQKHRKKRGKRRRK